MNHIEATLEAVKAKFNFKSSFKIQEDYGVIRILFKRIMPSGRTAGYSVVLDIEDLTWSGDITEGHAYKIFAEAEKALREFEEDELHEYELGSLIKRLGLT